MRCNRSVRRLSVTKIPCGLRRMSFPTRTASLSSSRTCSSLGNETRGCTRGQGSVARRQISKGRVEAARSTVDLGSFKRPVVRSASAVLRTVALPRLAPFLAAEWVVVARASLSLTRDAFSIGDNGRNTVEDSTQRGFAEHDHIIEPLALNENIAPRFSWESPRKAS